MGQAYSMHTLYPCCPIIVIFETEWNLSTIVKRRFKKFCFGFLKALKPA